MESRFPPEVINMVFNNCDPLTQLINNRLSESQIQSKATDIWNEAFEQDWAGDLKLLPANGFPTVLTGLCKMKSRTMYHRLCRLRPDLAGISDELKVFLHDTYWYGRFSFSPDFRPMVLLDDNDKLVDVDAMTDTDLLICIPAIGQHGNFEMLKFLEDRHHDWNALLRDNLSTLVEQSMESGHVNILHHIEPMLDDVNINDIRRRAGYSTKHLDCWKWDAELCQKYNLTFKTQLLVTSLAQAKYVAANLGPHSLDYENLDYIARNANFEAFDCLWSHRSDDFLSDEDNYLEPTWLEEFPRRSADGVSAMIFILDNHNFDDTDICHTVSLEAIKLLFTHKPQSLNLELFLDSAISYGNIEVVEFCLQHRAVPLRGYFLDDALNFNKQIRVAEMLYEYGCPFPTRFGIDDAAADGDLDVIKFLHTHVPTGCVESAMVEAAKKADYDMVVYLFEDKRGDCNIEPVLVEAIKSQSLRV
ncbi:hypothetical protein HDU76_006644 [Blyttiomyces sp. JEL0837]|nr:hypothetical protein HDU76_006644 [Blyttiomyces sp. JEL0837]